MEKRNKSTKNIYLIRFLLLPLLPFSHFATFGITACHGVEYLFVYCKMIRNSSVEKIDVRKIHILSTCFALFLIGLSAPMWLFDNADDNRIFFMMTSAYTAVSFIHFYLDRTLFRMRNVKTRRFVGPLLAQEIQMRTVS
jgi:hypothetical protein